MKKESTIAFIGAQDIMLDLYQPALDERHTLYPSTPHYTLVKTDTYASEACVLLTHSERYSVSYVANLLNDHVELRVLVFIAEGDVTLVNAFNQLALDYPLAVVEVAVQPIQPSRVWEFLDRTEAKAMHFEWEEGNWDDF